MPFDPFKHHRRSVRVKGYDYGQVGAYFVTIVTWNRDCLFEDRILRGIVESQWAALPRHFPDIVLDRWVVMPNHLHGIIVIENSENTNATERPGERVLISASLGAMVGNFKSVTARRINAVRMAVGAPVWQRNYYEHIVRDERDLDRIRTYIDSNPGLWDSDEENPLLHLR